MPLNRRVVITGYGAVTCLGQDAKSTWEAMRSGTSGIARLKPEPFDVFKDTWTVRIGGEIKDSKPTASSSSAKPSRLDRCTLLGLGAAVEAVDARRHRQFDAIDREHARRRHRLGHRRHLDHRGGRAHPRQPGPTASAPSPSRGSWPTRRRATSPSASGSRALLLPRHRLRLLGPRHRRRANYIRRGHAEVMVAGGTEAAITPSASAPS
jgi:3-oxoacyl-[acyl-carrier-protein] synthase II